MNAKHITSRQNELVKMIYKLVHTPGSYHQTNKIWLEGDHLCQAYMDKIGHPLSIVCSASSFEGNKYPALLSESSNLYVLDDALFEHISGLQSQTGIGFLISPNTSSIIDPDTPTVILDRLQDPGNVGSILRTAAAFGFSQIIAIKGTCALWSSKVLRAGMGAHFSLQIAEHVAPENLNALKLPIITTSSHTTQILQKSQLPWPCAWVFGHEGQGISNEITRISSLAVCIEQPGGEESLNAAIAASICMYESTRQKTN